MKQLRAVREDLANIRALALLRAPFFGFLLGKMRLILDGKVDTVCATTAGEVVVNPFFWEHLPDIEARTFVLLHEALHLAFRHPWLARRRNRVLYNLAADMVVNEMLFRHGYTGAPPPAVTAEMIYETLRAQGVEVQLEELRRASVEEVYHLLARAATRSACGTGEENRGDLRELERNREGLVVQEGDHGGENPERYWQAVVPQALVAAQEAGLIPADLKRQVEPSLRARVDWRRALRACLQEGTGRAVVTTWERASRRYASLPGIKRLGAQTIWTLVDCSGSIGEELLRRFVAEIYALARFYGCTLKILPWDARAYPAARACAPGRVKAAAAGSLRGGGGTVLRPALEALLARMRSRETVVILSDGYIADLADQATLQLYRRVTARAAQTVFITAGRVPRLPHTAVVRVL